MSSAGSEPAILAIKRSQTYSLDRFSTGLKWLTAIHLFTCGVKCSDLEWTDVIYVKWFCLEVQFNEVKCSEVSYVEVLADKVPCTIGWPYTECTWLYCDYFIWCVSWTVVVLTCFVICVCVCVCVCGGGVFWQSCGCFGNICTCIYCCVSFVSFMYIYLFLFVVSVLVYGLLPPSDNSIAVSK